MKTREKARFLLLDVMDAARQLLANICDAEQDKGEDGKEFEDVRELREALQLLGSFDALTKKVKP